MWRILSLFLMVVAASWLGLLPQPAHSKETLRIVTDQAAGVKIGIPPNFPTIGKTTRWGRKWISADGRVTINTLAFAPGRNIAGIFARLKSVKGRVLTAKPVFENGRFVMQGRDADGQAFYMIARQDGTVVRGFSIIYPSARTQSYALLVKRVADSFDLAAPDANASTAAISAPPASNAMRCTAETEQLTRLAREVAINVEAPDGLAVGGQITVSWQVASRFPLKTPVFLVFSMPDEMRILAVKAPDGTQSTPQSDGGAQLQKGYIALPSTASAPLDIAFGKGDARVLVPFHQPGSPTSSEFKIQPLSAGPWPIEYAIVAKTSCGERQLGESVKKLFQVNFGLPKVVIQDPYSLEKPNKVIVSNSGAYVLHVFKNKYRVFEAATGALIVERAGLEPNFSPTSRYLSAVTDGNNARGFKEHDVIDLVSGEVIAQTSGQLLGWSNGDAFLIDANQDYGVLSIAQPLVSAIDQSEGETESILSIADAPMSCHACTSSEEVAMTIDVNNAIVTLTNEKVLDANNAVVCELSGSTCENVSAGTDLTKIVQDKYAVAPFTPLDVAQSFQAISYSSIDYYSHYSQKLKLFQHHRQEPGQWQTSLRFASQKGGASGDWRGVVHPRAIAANAIGSAGFLHQLKAFGLPVVKTRTPELEVKWPTTGWANAEQVKLDRYEDKGSKFFDGEIAKFKVAFLSDFPEMGGRIAPDDEYPEFPYENKLADNQKLDFNRHLLGAWRFIKDGKPIWILQLHTVEGSAGFGHGAIFIVDGRKEAAKRITGAEKGLNGAIPAGETHQTRFQMSLVAGRYLLFSALINKEIQVYDIEQQKLLAKIPVPSDSDLQTDLRLTDDLRRIIQVNSDGQFFAYDIGTAKRILSGWYVDDEMLLYTPEGYFWSSYEGANLVHVKFPGMRGLYTLQQFASQLDKPEIIKKRLAGIDTEVIRPQLSAPPRLTVTPLSSPARLLVDAVAGGTMKSLKLFADGAPVKTIEVSGPKVKQEINLKDVPKARLLTVLAIDNLGLISQPQTVKLDMASQSSATLYGVFVGVNKYAPGVRQLKQAVPDARTAEAAFKSLNSTVYASKKTQLLTDENASPQALSSAIDAIAEEAKPEDTFVLFFAGHGLRSDDGEFYLTNSNFKADDPAGTGMSWQQLAQKLSRMKARVVLFIDACHSGTIGAELATNDDAVANLLKGTGRPIIVFAAAKGRQFSYESPDIQGGYFTYFLSRILTTDRARYDLNNNGILEISELYLALKEQVSTRVWKEVHAAQTPWLARRDMIGDFGLF